MPRVEVGIVPLGAPYDRVGAAGAGNPHRRVGFLQRYLEGVHHSEVVVLALPAEGARRCPRLENQVVGFLESLPVVHGVGIGGPGLGAAASDEARHQSPAGDHVNLGQLLSQAQGVVVDGQRVAHQHNLGLLGDAGQDGGFQIHGRAEAGGCVVMLVEHHALEAQFLHEFPLVQGLVVLPGGHGGVEVGIGKGDAHCLVGAAQHVFLGVIGVGPLGEPHQEQGDDLRMCWRFF